MKVDGAVLLKDVVMVDADRGIVGPFWIGIARDFWVELVYDGVTASVDVTMELYRCHVDVLQ